MNTSTRIAVVAASAAVVLWAAKATAIGIAGGLDKSPAEGPLFFAGLIACLTAASAIGVTLTRGRSTGMRILAGVLGPIAGLVVALLIDGLVGIFWSGQERPWVWTEFNLWVLAALTMAAAARVAAGQRGQAAALMKK